MVGNSTILSPNTAEKKKSQHFQKLTAAKASPKDKASKIKDPSKLLGYDLDTIIEYMKLRDTDSNIIKIKEELIALKNLNDGTSKNSLISHSQLNRESRLLADRVQTNNPLI